MSLREYGKYQSHVKYFCLGGCRGYFDHTGFLNHSRLPPECFACMKLGNDYVLFEKVTRASAEIYLTLLFQEKKKWSISDTWMTTNQQDGDTL